MATKEEPIPQPEVNIGTLGHVDNGKSTLVQAITGVWTARHSEELKRGITIRVGYADAVIYKCPKCPSPHNYSTSKTCPTCGSEAVFRRAISFVDCPGHHSLMVTMLSGAALMDGALFVLDASTKCPQAQDREHLLAAEITGIKNLIVVQNKIDIVTRERALENYKEIKEFIKGTSIERAPIIPVSAQHKLNVDALLEAIEKFIPTPKRNLNAPPRMYVLRSFDVNKPGTDAEDLIGGVLGGSISQGVFRVGDQIEISPGLRVESGGKPVYQPIKTTIESLHTSFGPIKEARCGGLVGVGTKLDPSLTKSDGLVGNVAGKEGQLPEILEKLNLDVNLFEKVVGTEKIIPVEKIKTNEALVLNVATTVTSGIVTSARESTIEVALRKPVCTEIGSRATISRRIGEGWRLIGYGVIK
ncbi:MAG: translation initiation factor IF-2 subunit gamma [Candidatus Bathyarchaeia archaeon]